MTAIFSTRSARDARFDSKGLIALLGSAALVVTSFGGIASRAEAQGQREFVQTIWLSGFKCLSVQRDSIVNPSNEVFFVLVTNAPTSEGMRGSSIGTFSGVVPGYSRKLRNRVWSGPQQPLSLRVMMFERDAGKESGATLARAMVAYGTSLMSTGSGAKTPYRNRPDMNSKPKGGALREDDQADPIWTRAYATVFDRALGLSHDPMGYDRQTFGRTDWSSRPTYNEKGIRYHFHTTHRQNGANCRAYFLIERGQEISRPERAAPVPPVRETGSYEPLPVGPYEDPNAIPYDPNGAGPGPDPNGPPPPFDPPPPPDYLPPPPPPPPPPEPEPDWFRARFVNRCDVPISLSYTYDNPDRGKVKRGWALLDPDESRPMEGNTLDAQIYVYTSRGRIQGSFDPQKINLHVRKNGFDVDRDARFDGAEGARMVPFSRHFLRNVSERQAILIVDCDEWIAGKLLSAAEVARAKQLREYRERHVQTLVNSALHDAAFAGDLKGIKAALKRGADINYRSARLGPAGATPLHLATMQFHGDAINLLLDEGADATKLSTTGGTVFHTALFYTNANKYFDDFPAKAFARLVEAGADPQKVDGSRRTPFEEISRRLTPQWVKEKLALQKGKPEKDSDYLSFLASRTTVNLDQKHQGVSPFPGHTALHTAAHSGHRPLAEALLANGADPMIEDNRGRIPRELAADWSPAFQNLFGPLPEKKVPPAKTAVAAPKPVLSPQKSDPAVDAERRRQLIERGVLAPDEITPADPPEPQ